MSKTNTRPSHGPAGGPGHGGPGRNLGVKGKSLKFLGNSTPIVWLYV